MSILKNKEIYDPSQGDPFKPILDGLKLLDTKADETKSKMVSLEKAIVGDGGDNAKIKELITNIQKLEAETTKLKNVQEAKSKIEQQLVTAQQRYIDLQTEQAKELARVRVENQNLNKSQIESAKVASNTTNQVMKYRIELRNLKAQLLDSKTSTEDYNKALQRAAFITDELGDMQARVKGTAMDFEGVMGNVSKVTQGTASAFEATQGAMALFGGESEDLQKTMLKVQASIALANGLQGLDGMGKALKNLGTQMMNFAPIQKTVTFLQYAWNTAIKANPIVAAISLIIALAGAVYGLTKIFEDDTEAIKRQNTATDGLTLSSKELKDEYQSQIDRIGQLKDEYDVLTGKMTETELKIKNLTRTYSQEIKTLQEQTREKLNDVGGFWDDFWSKVTSGVTRDKNGDLVTTYEMEVQEKKRKIIADSDAIIRKRAEANYYEKKKIEKEQQLKDEADAKSEADKKQKENEANFKKYQEQKKKEFEILLKQTIEYSKALAEMGTETFRRKDVIGTDNGAIDAKSGDIDASLSPVALMEQQVADMNALREADLQHTQEMEIKKREIIGETMLIAGEQFGNLLTSGNLTFKEFGKLLLVTALDVAEKMIQLSLVEIFAKEVASKSFAGLVTAPLLMGLVKGMFAGIKNRVMSFATGTEYVQGAGTETSDSIPANLSKGERVVPANVNKLLNGISNKDLPGLVNKGIQTLKMENLLNQIALQTKLSSDYLSNGSSIWTSKGYINIRDLKTGKIITQKND